MLVYNTVPDTKVLKQPSYTTEKLKVVHLEWKSIFPHHAAVCTLPEWNLILGSINCLLCSMHTIFLQKFQLIVTPAVYVSSLMNFSCLSTEILTIFSFPLLWNFFLLHRHSGRFCFAFFSLLKTFSSMGLTYVSRFLALHCYGTFTSLLEWLTFLAYLSVLEAWTVPIRELHILWCSFLI